VSGRYNAVHMRKLIIIDFESAIQSTFIWLNDEQSLIILLRY